MKFKAYTKLNKFGKSRFLLAIFRRTFDDLSVMFQQTPGKLLDITTIFLGSFDELLWQAPGLLGQFW